MDKIKRILGVVWMLLGPATLIFLVYEAWQKIKANPVHDVYLPWMIIVIICIPIAMGMVLFGYFAWLGEYSREKIE
ncbi:MAG: hypothetical protein JNK77_00840 [Saprospiraceae bacterium]|jgi:hypothetical protein|nr:hypothetical protein [Saprospiraceae bacterium]